MDPYFTYIYWENTNTEYLTWTNRTASSLSFSRLDLRIVDLKGSIFVAPSRNKRWRLQRRILTRREPFWMFSCKTFFEPPGLQARICQGKLACISSKAQGLVNSNVQNPCANSPHFTGEGSSHVSSRSKLGNLTALHFLTLAFPLQFKVVSSTKNPMDRQLPKPRIGSTRGLTQDTYLSPKKIAA